MHIMLDEDKICSLLVLGIKVAVQLNSALGAHNLECMDVIEGCLGSEDC